MFIGLSMKLVEDFGLHLGIHRLSVGAGLTDEVLVASRRNAFFSAFAADVFVPSPSFPVTLGLHPFFSV